jgi:hypothetical protein
VCVCVLWVGPPGEGEGEGEGPRACRGGGAALDEQHREGKIEGEGAGENGEKRSGGGFTKRSTVRENPPPTLPPAKHSQESVPLYT